MEDHRLTASWASRCPLRSVTSMGQHTYLDATTRFCGYGCAASSLVPHTEHQPGTHRPTELVRVTRVTGTSWDRQAKVAWVIGRRSGRISPTTLVGATGTPEAALISRTTLVGQRLGGGIFFLPADASALAASSACFCSSWAAAMSV